MTVCLRSDKLQGLEYFSRKPYDFWIDFLQCPILVKTAPHFESHVCFWRRRVRVRSDALTPYPQPQCIGRTRSTSKWPAPFQKAHQNSEPDAQHPCQSIVLKFSLQQHQSVPYRGLSSVSGGARTMAAPRILPGSPAGVDDCSNTANPSLPSVRNTLAGREILTSLPRHMPTD